MSTEQTEQKPNRPTTLYVRDVPRDVHDFFKAACIRRGSNMRREIIAFMREFIKDSKHLRMRPSRLK